MEKNKMTAASLFRTIRLTYHVDTARWINQLIFYFRKIPLIGKFLPESTYGYSELKILVLVLVSIGRFSAVFFGKALYIAVVGLLPLFVLEDVSRDIRFAVFVHTLFILSFIGGSLIKGTLFENTIDRYVMVKLMKMPIRSYSLAALVYTHGLDFIAFVPFTAIGALIAGGSFWQGALLGVMLVCGHVIGEALQLFVFAKSKLVLLSKIWWNTAIGVVCAVMAILPVFMNHVPGMIAGIVMHPAAVLLILLLTAGSILYILRFRNFQMLSVYSIKVDTLIQAKNATAASRSADVQLKDKDLKADDSNHLNHLRGYRYLNAMFFKRHRRMLFRPTIISILIILAVYAGAWAAMLLAPEVVREAAPHIPKVLPACVFAMYLLTAGGERATRAMFKNCDVAMLRIADYRRPAVLLKNFRIRLFWQARLNLMLAAVVALSLTTFAVGAGVKWPAADLALYILAILLLGVFFSVHYLFLYYVFQPFSTDMAIKNPFANIIKGVIYFLCLGALQMDSAPKNFTFIVLGATILYTTAALILVYRFAPKTFRIK